MITNMKQFAARFRREEEGSATVEFVLYFTVFFIVLAAAVEISFINLRHAMLERSVDMVTRDIRLSTGEVPSYASVKQDICEEATIMDDCEANLRLEMIQLDPRNMGNMSYTADCQNAAQDPQPVINFTPGQDNDLMMMRACLKYKPMMPTTQFGKQLNLDDDGYAQLVVTSAFVQEPR